MTTFTKRDSKFWEDYYNEKGRSNNENEMNARRFVGLSEFAYTFNNINNALQLEKDDVIADVGCAGGGMSVLFSSIVHKVFAYDIAKENIAYCKKSHLIDNVEFINEYIEKVDDAEINKMFLGAVFQHLSKEQLESFADSMCSEDQFPNLDKVFISHIPDIRKQYDWLDGYKNFRSDEKELEQLRHDWKYNNTWYEPEDMKKYFSGRFDITILDVDTHIVQHKYCFDALLERKK
jgi:hypothetical protein